jgi:hypothetical protein
MFIALGPEPPKLEVKILLTRKSKVKKELAFKKLL